MRSSTQPTKRNKPIIFLFGATASGKTALVERLFDSGFQIVNADSVQVYRHLDIGSAKPSVELMEKIPHHLVNVREPWEEFTVGDFVNMADEAVEKIYSVGDIPVIAGGTAYFFRHFFYGLSQAPKVDGSVRARIAKELKEKGSEEMYHILKEVDPVSASRINPHDVYRVTRALEVHLQTGRPLSSFEVPSEPREGMRPLILSVTRDRDELYRRIDLRVDEMFSCGLVDEIRSLRRMGAREDWPAMGAIGYSEFFQAFSSGCMPLSTIRDLIRLHSRQYAKRQLTFFRSFSEAVEVAPSQPEDAKKKVDSYLSTF